MATGQPKTKASELLGRIHSLGEARRPSEFEIARIRAEAARLLSTDTGSASEILGLVAALDFDEAGVHRHFDRALKIRPSDPRLHTHHSVALMRLGLFEGARQSIDKARVFSPGDPQILDAAIRWYAMSGMLSEASNLCNIWFTLKPDSPHGWCWAINRGLECLHENRIEESEVVVLVDHAIRVLRDARIELASAEVLSMADEEAEWLSIHYVLWEPVKKVVELNVQMAERLALIEPPLRAAQFVTVMYLVSG